MDRSSAGNSDVIREKSLAEQLRNVIFTRHDINDSRGILQGWEIHKVWDTQVNMCRQKPMEKDSVSRKYEPTSDLITPIIFSIDNWFIPMAFDQVNDFCDD
jgi:hypothetical protein